MLYDIAAVEIGQHWYWSVGGFQVHGQVLVNTWIVFAIILIVGFTTTRQLTLQVANLSGGQNFIEFFMSKSEIFRSCDAIVNTSYNAVSWADNYIFFDRNNPFWITKEKDTPKCCNQAN